MEMSLILLLVWMHYIADFLIQDNAVGQEHIDRGPWKILAHATLYGLIFALISPMFALITIILHFIVDYFTVKVGYKFWNKGDTYWFFTVIGADGALHLTALILTYCYLHGVPGNCIVVGMSIFLIWLHFIADFLLQSEYVVKNKSKNNKTLLLHATVYSLLFFIISPVYAIVNGVLHLMVDYVTSRMTCNLWKQGKISRFFSIVGFDQAVHVTLLLGTYHYMFY